MYEYIVIAASTKPTKIHLGYQRNHLQRHRSLDEEGMLNFCSPFESCAEKNAKRRRRGSTFAVCLSSRDDIMPEVQIRAKEDIIVLY